MQNLYDKYKMTKWDQLWADDHIAVVLYHKPAGWQVLEDNGRIAKRSVHPNFSEGLDEWNDVINRHLENCQRVIDWEQEGLNSLNQVMRS